MGDFICALFVCLPQIECKHWGFLPVVLTDVFYVDKIEHILGAEYIFVELK